MIVGKEIGGHCYIVEKDPSWRDIAPYFLGHGLYAAGLIAYWTTGKLILPLGFFLFMSPMKIGKGKDDFNLSKRAERQFFYDWRFDIPLHTYILLDALAWIWQLIVFSDVVKIDYPIFKNMRPETNW